MKKLPAPDRCKPAKPGPLAWAYGLLLSVPSLEKEGLIIMKIVNIKTYRVLKDRQNQEFAYRLSLSKMDKAQLLQELLNYHDRYQRDPHDVNVTIRAQHLMEVLEERAELKELQDLSREFQNKLKMRLYEQMQSLGN